MVDGGVHDVDALSLMRCLNEADEHSRCEAKTASQIGRSLMETVCAFANEPGLGGGHILLGVGRSDRSFWPSYDVVGIDHPDQMQSEIATACRTQFNRPVRPQIRTETVRGKPVLVVFVPELGEAEKPLFFANEGLPRGAFRRIGSTDQRCSEDDLLLFYSRRKIETYDRQQVADAALSDIDETAVRTYRTMRADIKPDAEELEWSNEDLLQGIGCVQSVGRELKPTVAGLLLFGRKQSLRRCFPMMRIDYIRVPGLRWVENPDTRFETIEIREPLISAIRRARSTILDDLPRAFSLPEGRLQRSEVPALPERVVREVVVNAVMHRCYRTNSSIQVIRYTNRIEIRNPGHSLVSEERFGQPGSETRNPVIAAVLYDIGLAETKGSGIRVMQQLMQDAMLAPPVFESNRSQNQFVAYLLLHHLLSPADLDWLAGFQDLNLTDQEKLGLIVAREMGAIDNATYRSVNGVDTLASSGHLRRLRDCGLLEMKGKGSGTYYVPTETLLHPAKPQSGGLVAKSGGLASKSGGLPAEVGGKSSSEPESPDFGEVPEEVAERIARIGGKGSRVNVRMAILELCAWRPLMPAEIAKYLSRKSVKRLVEDYVSPMFEERLLERTIPQIPAHPGQRYRTTGKGTAELL